MEGDVIAMDMVEQRQYSGHAKVEGRRAGGTGSQGMRGRWRWRSGVVAAHGVAGHGRRGHAKVETEGTRCAVAAG